MRHQKGMAASAIHELTHAAWYNLERNIFAYLDEHPDVQLPSKKVFKMLKLIEEADAWSTQIESGFDIKGDTGKLSSMTYNMAYKEEFDRDTTLTQAERIAAGRAMARTRVRKAIVTDTKYPQDFEDQWFSLLQSRVKLKGADRIARIQKRMQEQEDAAHATWQQTEVALSVIQSREQLIAANIRAAEETAQPESAALSQLEQLKATQSHVSKYREAAQDEVEKAWLALEKVQNEKKNTEQSIETMYQLKKDIVRYYVQSREDAMEEQELLTADTPDAVLEQYMQILHDLRAQELEKKAARKKVRKELIDNFYKFGSNEQDMVQEPQPPEPLQPSESGVFAFTSDDEKIAKIEKHINARRKKAEEALKQAKEQSRSSRISPAFTRDSR